MSITDLVPVPSGINVNVRSAKQQTMLTLLGQPRSSYSDQDQPITNPSLKALMVTEAVGPFRATGLKPAVESLRKVFSEIQTGKPEVYAALKSAGMLCVRYVRNSTTSISNHSWGTAIDLKISGILDPYGDGTVQRGLVEIAPYFNKYGWYWGASFRVEDGMHFECGEDLIRSWAAQGLLGGSDGGGGSGGNGGGSPGATDEVLSVGDRGPEVTALQKRLNASGASLKTDGVFGNGTRDAVMAFQTSKGLKADGVVGPATLVALPPLP
ncbi:peptidoglycan-binding protein [Azospirillum oleiclasticum]|nr:peptidoglycan-binding protein [Azospirillum oleiclasticum]